MNKHRSLNKKFVTAKWLVENVFLGISKHTIYKWAREGIFPAYKVGGSLLFDLEEVIEAVKEKVVLPQFLEERINEILKGMR